MAAEGSAAGDATITFIKDISRRIDTGAFALVANVSVFVIVSRLTGNSREGVSA